MAVYCERCRWYQSMGIGDEEQPERCMKILGYYSDYQCKKITSRTDGKPSDLNANNDCAYYSWDWFGFRGY